ncbi:M23 family metallopeptidase [Candidatus Dependentiae bacterium]|nr:M23 family metallopeptidase [Candidatus Dependentiae bacterium]
MIILLIGTYRDLMEQGKQLVELKNEYDTYVLVYKKIFDEYKTIKQAGGSSSGQELIPVMEKDSGNSFEVVNRNANYLAESACDFGKNYNLEDSLRFLYGLDGSRYEEPRRPVSKKRKRVQGKSVRSSKRRPMISLHPRTDIPMQWPILRDQFWLSSRFGWRKRGQELHFHTGIDLAAMNGTLVTAAARGVVIEVSFSKKGYGNTIVIAHGQDRTSRYAHLETIKVRYGQKVEAGQQIGCVGATGLVLGRNGKKSASHLHFEVKEHGKHVDPLLILT